MPLHKEYLGLTSFAGFPKGKFSPNSELNLVAFDHNAHRFFKVFTHYWEPILASVPPFGKAQWKTIGQGINGKSFPYEPRVLWEYYCDPQLLLGLGFGRETRYLLIDVDAGSDYHPSRSPDQFFSLVRSLEAIGLCRYLLVQSSCNGGLHVYFPLPEPVSSFALAVAAKQALSQEGFQLRDGQLELRPNVKHYRQGRPSNYQPHRLPLQAGSFLLNGDLEPVSNDLTEWLNAFDCAAQQQDFDQLTDVLPRAVASHKQGRHLKPITQSAELWRSELETVLAQGWTGPGQSNQLFKNFAVFGRVFQGLGGEDLQSYIVESARSAPGFFQFSNHVHDLTERARDWQRQVEETGYYLPYCAHPKRQRTFRDAFGALLPNKVVPIRGGQNFVAQVNASERITLCVEHLELEGVLPSTASARAEAISAKSRELYGKGIGFKTLYKPDNLSLWHPSQRCEILQPEPVSSLMLDHQLDTTETEVRETEGGESVAVKDTQRVEIDSPPELFHTLPIYEGGGEGGINSNPLCVSDSPDSLPGISPAYGHTLPADAPPTNKPPLSFLPHLVRRRWEEWRAVPKTRPANQRWAEAHGLRFTDWGPMLL